MRGKQSVLLLLAAVFAVAACAPAKNEAETSTAPIDSEIVIVPLEHHSPALLPKSDEDFGDEPIVDTGYFSGPFSFNPFGNLFESIESMMYRMRQQLNQVLSRLPPKNQSDQEFHIPSFSDIDLNKANTTSVVKVINGHKVVVNETEYKQEGEHGGTFFKVRIIDVKPDSSETATAADVEPLPTTVRDVESVEDTLENEISKSKETEDTKYENLEMFEETESRPAEKLSYGVPALENRFENTNDIEIPDDSQRPPIDLSRDIYINQLMADAGAPINPDAEIFDPIDAQVGYKYRPNAQFEKMVNPR